MQNGKHLLVLTGPTASGKTALAIELAKIFDTVIISADSRQFYKEMQIGTAAPTPEELVQVPHFLIHHKSIFETYDVADYEQDVLNLLDLLFEKHQIVILTGGSGLFIDAVCKGLDLIPSISNETRKKVADLLQNKGLKNLQKEVETIDPEYYNEVDRNNPRRLQRALEVYYQTGKKFSSFRNKQDKERNFNIIRTAILWERSQLIKRINQRVDSMIEAGLYEEAKTLYPYREQNALKTVGYQEIFNHFDGNCSFEEAIEQIKTNTRRYAKRQMTWLRKNTDYQWFSLEAYQKIITYVNKIIF
ncbi:MAG: tRNA (adenosine(37)-N6)-dimethylallyltransferase MiaA [Lentimicrobiaceae bacterium]|jgi:tRNA dimethylallyltransferase|nr:tRNA (adenosine(37)-N6)-dimethylallyltransferase MiaA [Lentimicrobiaceae bacterium]